MCECYKVGGRFIAEDPDCPAHGTEAQRQREIDEEDRQSLEDRIAQLEETVAQQDYQIRMLSERISQTGKE